jgi:surface polysaccharide O-acyltransferase-like enzyme
MFIYGSVQLLWSVMNLCSTSVGSILFGTYKSEIVGNSNDDFLYMMLHLFMRLWAIAMMIFLYMMLHLF